MSWSGLVVAGVGLVVLVASVVAARHPFIPDWEQRTFRAINGLPAWLYAVLWLPMQLGNLVVGTAAGFALATWAGQLDVAAAVVVAAGLKLVTERIIRREMAAYLEVRQRPGTSEPWAVLRGGDVPTSGPSFPSGHVILVAAVASLAEPLVSSAWAWAPFTLAVVVMVGRVYVGAHNPLDTTAGLGAGLLVGGLLSAIVS